jgi:putative transcriptional regulator
MISIIDRDVPEAIPAWYGGPIDTATAIILHDRKLNQGDREIAPGINLSSTGRILDSLIDHGAEALQNQLTGHKNPGDTSHPYRFLVGYAGWGAGQLDDELRSGSWLMCPLDRKLVFDTPWNDLWVESMQRVGIQKTTIMSPVISVGSQFLN